MYPIAIVKPIMKNTAIKGIMKQVTISGLCGR